MIENCSCHINPPCPSCSDSFYCNNCYEQFSNDVSEEIGEKLLCGECFVKAESNSLPYLDISSVRHTVKPLVKQWIDRTGLDKLETELSELPLSTSCHILAICQFIGELYGWNDELKASFDRKLMYYRYGGVRG